MRISWFYKLMAAFLLVIAIGALVLSTFVSRATSNAFSLYTTRSGQIWAQRLAPYLENYYLQTSTWDGVTDYIETNLDGVLSTGESSGMMAGQGMGQGPGGHGMGGAQPFSNNEMMDDLGQRLILTDAAGIVIYDNQATLVGKALSGEEISKGTFLFADQEPVGTLLVAPNDFAGSDSPAAEFLATVKQAIFTSAIVASAIALLVGGLLFRQITRPLRQLTKAATSIANGDLKQSVRIKSHDEFGELGESFNSMASNLEKAERQRQHMVADVAHELRTPLAAIQGTLEAMQDGVLPVNEEQLQSITAETQLLNRLVGDLRLLSLAETSHLHLEMQEISLGELTTHLVERFKVQADEKTIALKAIIQPGLPPIPVDPDRIAQVINNLFANALRYTPNRGEITIEVNRESETSEQVIKITDTGPGIEPENLPHVFDRFYRADKSRTRASGGSGLGLAIVKSLIEAHGGKVTVESPVFLEPGKPGHGTRFLIKLNGN